MKRLLTLAALGEALAGLILLVYPFLVIRLLFDSEITGAGVVMSRIAGIALIALGVACWPDRNPRRAFFGSLDLQSARNAVSRLRGNQRMGRDSICGRRLPFTQLSLYFSFGHGGKNGKHQSEHLRIPTTLNSRVRAAFCLRWLLGRGVQLNSSETTQSEATVDHITPRCSQCHTLCPPRNLVKPLNHVSHSQHETSAWHVSPQNLLC